MLNFTPGMQQEEVHPPGGRGEGGRSPDEALVDRQSCANSAPSKKTASDMEGGGGYHRREPSHLSEALRAQEQQQVRRSQQQVQQVMYPRSSVPPPPHPMMGGVGFPHGGRPHPHPQQHQQQMPQQHQQFTQHQRERYNVVLERRQQQAGMFHRDPQLRQARPLVERRGSDGPSSHLLPPTPTDSETSPSSSSSSSVPRRLSPVAVGASGTSPSSATDLSPGTSGMTQAEIRRMKINAASEYYRRQKEEAEKKERDRMEEQERRAMEQQRIIEETRQRRVQQTFRPQQQQQQRPNSLQYPTSNPVSNDVRPVQHRYPTPTVPLTSSVANSSGQQQLGRREMVASGGEMKGVLLLTA